MFTFDQLPIKMRPQVYNNCIPERLEFDGPKEVRNVRWPQHPLSNLIRALPRKLSQEINMHVFTNCRFEFIAARSKGGKYVDGFEFAGQFFKWIGPIKFGLIRQMYCDIDWQRRAENLDGIFGFLEDIATCPPRREIKNVHLRVKSVEAIGRSRKGIRGKRACFSLIGFPGMNITLLFLGLPASDPAYPRRAINQTSDVNRWIQQRHDPGQLGSLMDIPPEVSVMIYKYFVPDEHAGKTSRWQWKTDPNKPMLPMLRLNNRIVTKEYRQILYKTCCFNIIVESHEDPQAKQIPSVESFLRRIGENAAWIRKLKVTFVAGRFILTPSILPILSTINGHCSLGAVTVDRTLPYKVDDDIDARFAKFAVGVKTTSIDLTIEVRILKSGPTLLSPSQVFIIMEASINGIPTTIDTQGQIQTAY